MPTAGPLKVSPAQINFSKRKIGVTAEKTINLSNPKKNKMPVVLTAIALTGSSGFQIASTTCPIGSELAAGARCKVIVSFTPTAIGSVTAQSLMIEGNAANNPVAVPLNGAGK